MSISKDGAFCASTEEVSTSPPTNPADNDFEGMCIQCTVRKARTLKLFNGNNPEDCNAFCSMNCAQLCALEFANQTEWDGTGKPATCEHLVRDGDYCEKCRINFMDAAQDRISGGVE